MENPYYDLDLNTTMSNISKEPFEHTTIYSNFMFLKYSGYHAKTHTHTWREGLKHTRDSDEYSIAVFCKKATIISSEKKLNKPDCNQTESHQNMA